MKEFFCFSACFSILFFSCSPPKQNPEKEAVKATADISDTFPQPVKVLEKEHVEYAYPHWSNDGKKILFQSNESGSWQICTVNEDGSGLTRITNDSFNNNFIDWSPDNQYICFVSDRTGNDEIFTMRTDGTELKQLTDNPARDIHPYWSPDGQKIFFNSTRNYGGDFEIYVMNADGSGVEQLTEDTDEETCARLSPAGRQLVYLKNNAGGLDDVFIMDLDSKAEENITNTSTTDGWPSWTPDGKKILYAAMENNLYALFLYDTEKKSSRKLTNPPSPQYDCRANLSADGTKIVFNRQKDGMKNTIGIYVAGVKS